MLIRDHLKKIQRIEQSRSKLVPLADYELWYFATMTAAVNAMNAALHAAGATVAERCFAHNVPVYYRPGRRAGTFAPVVRPFGDIEHVDSPEVEALIPERLGPAALALKQIEALREQSVRGNLRPSRAIVARIETAYRRCLAASDAVIGADTP